MSEKWTKKDIRVMQGHLETAWLLSRPLSQYAGLTSEAEVAFRRVLEKHRSDLVLSGVRCSIFRASERYAVDCECVGNEIVLRPHGDASSEIVERFAKSAREELAGREKAEVMLQRLLKDGLPPEVENYDPILRIVVDRAPAIAKL